jgi:general secretion pathway protein E
MHMTDEIKDAITNKLDAGEIQKLAIAAGMTTMLDDGLSKVKSGITTIEEVMRVTTE